MEPFVTPELIHAIAHSVDIPELSPAAAKALAPDVEYKLRELIQDGHKFARHAQRVKLTTEDVNNALRMRNAEPLYGYSYKKPSKPKPAAADDKGKAKTDEVERGVKYIKVVGQSNVYTVEDRELTVEQLIDEPLPRAPVEVGVMPHWLFIEGVQPLTPENTPLEKPLLKKARPAGQTLPGAAGKAGAGAAAVSGQASGGAGPESANSVQVQLPVQHVLPLELQLYFNKAMDIISSALAAAKAPGAGQAKQEDSQAAAGAARPAQQHTHWGDFSEPPPTAAVPPAAAEANGHAAPAESGPSTGLQAHSPEAKLSAVLASLTTDAGLHPLTPYWVKYICDEVAASLPHVPALCLLLRLAKALLHNESLRLDEYVHQLLPALLTCVVARGIGSSNLSRGTSDALADGGHPVVRKTAAELVAEVCARFGGVHLNVQPRVSKTLLNALLDTSKPLTTHYGAVVGLSALGPTAVRLLLLPNLPAYLDRLTPLLTPPSDQQHSQPQGATSNGSGPHDMDIDQPPGGGGKAGGAPSATINALQAQKRYAEAVRLHGAVLDAVATALYELMVDKAAGAVPDAPLCGTRPSAGVLRKVAEAFQQQQQQLKGAHGTTPATEPDSDRARAAALLAVSWREDVSLSDVAWAAGELLGPALLARLPQARPAQACL